MTEEEQEKQAVELPECGRRLRRTREQLGLSVDDIASELRLSSFQIRALEDDDWDQLPGTTYARGYVKAYARLLGLDVDQMLVGASTEEIEISRTEPETDDGNTGDDAPMERRPRFAAAWTLGLLLLCVLAVAAWQFRSRLQWVPGYIDGQIAAMGVRSEPNQTAPGMAAVDEGEPAAVAVDAATGTGVESAPGAEAGVAAATPSAMPPAPTDPSHVVFQFVQASWIEVEDARGKRLLHRRFRTGSRIEVEGQPPFRVFLGNAEGVKVEYLGQVSTRGAAPGRRYARFVLGSSSG